jgi:SecD/SecF fusion protein
MQGKGLIRFFLFLLLAVALYQFMLIIPSNRVEKNAEDYAASMAAKAPEKDKDFVAKQARVAYLDSMSSETVFSIPLLMNYTYQDLKRQQVSLGLDLKGGMSVVLGVDLREFILSLANNSKDPTLEAALDEASKNQANAAGDYVTLFGEAWRKVANGQKLANIFSVNESLRDEINSQSTDAQVISVIRGKANQTVDLTYKMLKERIDKFGVTQPNVSLDPARDLILVELPGVDNPQRARNLLETTAALEFWDVYRLSEGNLFDAFQKADEKLGIILGDSLASKEPAYVMTETKVYLDKDSLGIVRDSSKFELRKDSIPNPALTNKKGPLFSIFQFGGGGPIMGLAEKNKREQISKYLAMPEIKALFPGDVRFLWAEKPIKDEAGKFTRQYYMYAIKVPADEKAPLQGDHITNARVSPDPNTGEIQVSLTMDGQGAQTWGDMTTKAARDQNREIAIVLDNQVVSAPRVNEPILGGSSQISGSFTTQEGQDLANILQVGKLPAKAKIIQEAVVGPTLGQSNINRSLNALLIGFCIVLVFMLLYYAGAGVVSILALLANLVFVFAALSSMGAVLTLPGIAGIVLTIGMAVDANVIIYERIREELHAGKTKLQAIKDGFFHSYSAIIDANVTTLIVAFVLLYFGLGPIKGFATVLWIGVLSSMFCAVLVSRLMIDWWTIDKGKDIKFASSWSDNLFKGLNVDWMGKRKYLYMVSGAYIILGIGSMLFRGFDLGVDFRGGYSYTVQIEDGKNVGANDLRTALTPVFGDKEPIVKTFDAANTFSITTDYLVKDQSDEAPEKVMAALYKGINGLVGNNLELKNFEDANSTGTHILSSTKIGPTIADDIQKSSFWSTLISISLIFLYILIRFRRWQFSTGTVSALIHDVLIILSTYSLLWGILPWSLEIDQAFVAALLTVIGYSTNDTIIVFDRIREYIDTYSGKSKKDIINAAINSTMSRTLITSGTTIVTILILFLIGSGSIKSFAFAITFGIIVGTYSSIFVASPILYDLTNEFESHKKDVGKKGTHFSDVLKERHSI